jgi:hypothetical protein
MAVVKVSPDLRDETFLRTVIFPEEERRLFTTTPWSGGYRWFKASNVVCLDRYRSPAEMSPNPKQYFESAIIDRIKPSQF